MPLPEYFIGKGDVKFAKLDANGNPQAFTDRGEASLFEFDLSVDYADNFRTGKTGPNEQDLHVPIKRALGLNLNLKEVTAANLEFLLHGGVSAVDTAGSYVANGPFPSGILAGESYLVPGGHNGISVLVIKDSAGTPAALAVNTNYTYDADSGLVTFVNLGTFVQPFTAFSYTFKVATVSKILSTTPGEVCVIFDGVNLAVPGEKVFVRLDRVAFMPASKISMKGDAPVEYDLKGVALLKPGNVQSDGYGVYRVF